MSVLTRARKFGLATLAGAAFAVAPTLVASAHVSVSSADAVGGGTGTLAFRVPNESDTASTTSVTIELPADTPFRSVRAEALPGWTIEVARTTLAAPVEIGGATVTEAVSSVTWTADGAGIGPDQYGMFTLRVGPFPDDGGTFAFPAVQTYDDGEVVSWSDPTAEGEAEPEHPAPTLEVAAGSADADDHGHATEEADEQADDGASGASDTTARVLGIAGIVIGVAGLATGALLGRKRNPSPAGVDPS